ncbi:MAG: hypothetical protein AAF570_19785, partial [Bacteroidota bacterium]
MAAPKSKAALNPGDIAFISMQVYSYDRIAFVAMRDIPGGEVFYVTDKGWQMPQNSFRSGEDIFTITVPAQGWYTGQVITMTWQGSLSYGGDQVFAFQGSPSNPSFIAGIQIEGNGEWKSTSTNSNNSALPPGLHDGFTAISLPQYNQGRFDCSSNYGNRAWLLTRINDESKWEMSNSITAMPVSNCGFSVINSGPSVAFGPMPEISEGDGSFDIRVFSDVIGNHTAQLSLNGGNLVNGSDINFSNPTTVSFQNSQLFSVTVNLNDDADCESTESGFFYLTSANGCGTPLSPLEVQVVDNEQVQFRT